MLFFVIDIIIHVLSFSSPLAAVLILFPSFRFLSLSLDALVLPFPIASLDIESDKRGWTIMNAAFSTYTYSLGQWLAAQRVSSLTQPR